MRQELIQEIHKTEKAVPGVGAQMQVEIREAQVGRFPSEVQVDSLDKLQAVVLLELLTQNCIRECRCCKKDVDILYLHFIPFFNTDMQNSRYVEVSPPSPSKTIFRYVARLYAKVRCRYITEQRKKLERRSSG
jgi:hypothetical protein